MDWYIILGIIASIIVGFIIGYLIKKRRNLQLDESLIEEYNGKIKNKQNELDILVGNINNLKGKLDNLKRETNSAINSFNNLTRTLKESQDRELQEHYEKEFNNIKEKLKKADEILCINYNQNKQKYDKEIQEIQKELEELKSARKVIIEEQKRQEQIQTNQNFYMLQISEYDKEDIKQLRTIEPLLHNRDVLNKLIWSTYYQTPLKDLIGRVIGTRKISGIYKITCIDNKKAYIGKSVDISERWIQHTKSSLEIGTIAKNQLYTLMKEKGAERFTFEILEEVEKDKLLERESYWIKFYETDSFGLNMKG